MLSRTMLVKITGILILLLLSAAVPVMVSAQDMTQGDTTGNDTDDSSKGTGWDIRKNYFLRYPVAKEFGPSTVGGGHDVIQNGKSMGPGTIQHNKSGPVQLWPTTIMEATSSVPTKRDEAIMEDLFQTFGYPVSDTQFQIIQRYNDNRMLEQLFDPERLMWMGSAVGGIMSTSAANSAANLERNQSAGAIKQNQTFLQNFTTQSPGPTNPWYAIRDQLFIPIAVLLLLPGAVATQVKAIIAQGFTIFGDAHPFDGIIRSIIAIFLIPATYLIISWGIDLSNSIQYTIASEYTRIFGSDMYFDAQCAHDRAFPINPPTKDANAMNKSSTDQVSSQMGDVPYAAVEALSFNLNNPDPCQGQSSGTGLMGALGGLAGGLFGGGGGSGGIGIGAGGMIGGSSGMGLSGGIGLGPGGLSASGGLSLGGLAGSLFGGGGGGSQTTTSKADEYLPALYQIQRLGVNAANASLAATWTIMSAFQQAYLYYLWCMGPVVAALWVWPIAALRKALPSWVEGVITLCFWSLFWNTCILLMACFRNVSVTGTIYMTALNLMANLCVKYAFNFAAFCSQVGLQGAQQAKSMAGKAAEAVGAHAGHAAAAAQGAGGGHGGAPGTGAAGHGGTAGAGPGAGTGSAPGSPGATAAPVGSGGLALGPGGGPGHSGLTAGHTLPGQGGPGAPPGSPDGPGGPGGTGATGTGPGGTMDNATGMPPSAGPGGAQVGAVGPDGTPIGAGGLPPGVGGTADMTGTSAPFSGSGTGSGGTGTGADGTGVGGTTSNTMTGATGITGTDATGVTANLPPGSTAGVTGDAGTIPSNVTAAGSGGTTLDVTNSNVNLAGSFTGNTVGLTSDTGVPFAGTGTGTGAVPGADGSLTGSVLGTTSPAAGFTADGGIPGQAGSGIPPLSGGTDPLNLGPGGTGQSFLGTDPLSVSGPGGMPLSGGTSDTGVPTGFTGPGSGVDAITGATGYSGPPVSGSDAVTGATGFGAPPISGVDPSGATAFSGAPVGGVTSDTGVPYMGGSAPFVGGDPGMPTAGGTPIVGGDPGAVSGAPSFQMPSVDPGAVSGAPSFQMPSGDPGAVTGSPSFQMPSVDPGATMTGYGSPASTSYSTDGGYLSPTGTPTGSYGGDTGSVYPSGSGSQPADPPISYGSPGGYTSDTYTPSSGYSAPPDPSGQVLPSYGGGDPGYIASSGYTSSGAEPYSGGGGGGGDVYGGGGGSGTPMEYGTPFVAWSGGGDSTPAAEPSGGGYTERSQEYSAPQETSYPTHTPEYTQHQPAPEIIITPPAPGGSALNRALGSAGMPKQNQEPPAPAQHPPSSAPHSPPPNMSASLQEQMSRSQNLKARKDKGEQLSPEDQAFLDAWNKSHGA